MAALPMAVGCIIGGVLMEKYGRKVAHLILNVPFVMGWIAIALSQSLLTMLAGRFICGFCVGLLGPPATVYIGETSEPKYRGFLLAAVSLAIAVGILVSHLLGTFFNWKLTAILCSLVPLSSYISMSMVPESPSWLLSKGRVEDALRSYQWLRGCSDEANKEFESMVSSQNTSSTVNNYSWENVKLNIKRPGFLKPLGILLIFFIVMQFSGVNAVAFYCVTIMKNTIGDGLNEYVAMTIIDLVRVLMSVVACILLRKFGRRPLAFISGTGTALSLVGLSTFLYFTKQYPMLTQFSSVPMALLIGYICFVSIGIVPLPWCMNGELFPLALRGVGSGIVSSVNFLALFTVVKTGPLFFLNIGAEGAFMIYGAVAFLGTIFLFFCLPETKNKTLQEIENSFEGSKKLTATNGVDPVLA